MQEKRAEFPLWLEYSGLPNYVSSKVRKDAWCVFKKIVELDCAVNIEPGVVEISIDDLSLRTGIQPEMLVKCLEKLKKKKLVACFVPDNTEEKALFRVVFPMETPLSPEEIKEKWPDIFPPGKDFFRYLDQNQIGAEDDEILHEVVDAYFNTLGLKMNLFILDELRLMRQRFELSDIKKAFKSANKNNAKSLRWVIRQLMPGKAKDVKAKKSNKR
jgi:DNA replication protein DnaD